MYEVGKPRLDGKYNVWRKTSTSDFQWEWQVVGVYDSHSCAQTYADMKNQNKARRQKSLYKVNQND